MVTSIRTVTTPVPVAGDDQKAFTYSASGASYLLRHLRFKNVTKTANYTVTTNDLMVLVDTTLGPVTITLPTAVGIPGTAYMAKKITSDANPVFVVPTAGQRVDGQGGYALRAVNDAIVVASDNANWWIPAGWIAPSVEAGYRSFLYLWMGGAGE